MNSVLNAAKKGRLKVLLRRSFSLNSRDHAFAILGLKSFSDSEIKQSFRKLQEITKGSTLELANKDNKLEPLAPSVNVQEGIQRLAEAEYAVKLDQKTINKVSRAVLGASPTPASTDDAQGNVQNGGSPVLLTLPEYRKKVLDLGEKLDPRVWNIGLSFLCTGTSVGIIIPCMPLLVSQLHIPANEFGLVVSAFGLSKLLGNIPSGYFVEKYGRKPSLVAGLGMCGVGLGALGLALLPGFGTPWLIACRFVSGLGVSAFVAGGYMFMSDISTPLNRTRTIAPVMAGFSGGAALGPAVGGVLIDNIGIGPTYATVGGLFLSLAAMNSLLLHETKVFSAPPSTAKIIDVPAKDAATQSSVYSSTSNTSSARSDNNSQNSKLQGVEQGGVLSSFSTAFKAWKVLWNDPNKQIRNTVTMNGMFWFTLSGTQMTLLPLLMVAPAAIAGEAQASVGLAMSAAELGASFAFMSLVSFVSAQPVAYVADKYGKVPTMLAGCTLLSASMFALPLTTGVHLTELSAALPMLSGLPSYTPALVAVLLPFALGTTALNATPTALMSDLTESSSRAQALSLLRTAGDFGLLLGASCAGAVAHFSSLETALQLNGTLTAGAMLWFAAKNRHLLSVLLPQTPTANK